MKTEHKHRDGATMVLVSVETRPAVVEFSDIRDAVKVEPDEWMSEKPWENCCGYDHELRLPNDDGEADSEACIHHDRRQRIIDVPCDTDLFNWYRKNGASRQVAREAVARARQRKIEQLAKWYSDGWEWWAVSCDYLDASASVCGVDEYGYASGACADEIAEEVAAELVKAGYTVNGIPDSRRSYLDNRRYHLRLNQLIGTWN
jgi:hypothetical protein